MEETKLLTTKKMREIITDFIENCSEQKVKRFGFDESFWETTSEWEETWEDTDSEDMKRRLIENYLYQFGYHAIEQDDEKALSEQDLINEYFKNK